MNYEPFDEAAIYDHSKRIIEAIGHLTPNQQLIVLDYTARKIEHNGLIDDLTITAMEGKL